MKEVFIFDKTAVFDGIRGNSIEAEIRRLIYSSI